MLPGRAAGDVAADVTGALRETVRANPRRVLAFVGAGAVALGSALPWFRPTSGSSRSAWNLAVHVLVDNHASLNGFPIRMLLLAVAGGAVLAARDTNTKARGVAGAVGLGIVMLYVVQLKSAIDEIHSQGGHPAGLGHFAGPGVFVVAVGALAPCASAWLRVGFAPSAPDAGHEPQASTRHFGGSSSSVTSG